MRRPRGARADGGRRRVPAVVVDGVRRRARSPTKLRRSRRATSFFAAHAPRVMASLAASSPVFLAGTAAPRRRPGARASPRSPRPPRRASRGRARPPKRRHVLRPPLPRQRRGRRDARRRRRLRARRRRRHGRRLLQRHRPRPRRPRLPRLGRQVPRRGRRITGCRSVALKNPLDLSAYDGIALTCGFESDDEPERRTWKATVRTQNDRGEMVYQATFVPRRRPIRRRPRRAAPEIRILWTRSDSCEDPPSCRTCPRSARTSAPRCTASDSSCPGSAREDPCRSSARDPFDCAARATGCTRIGGRALAATLASAAADNAGSARARTEARETSSRSSSRRS